MTSSFQLLATAAPADAILLSAIRIRKLLRAAGPSEIYAWNVHDDLAGDVLPAQRLVDPAQGAADVAIFHASIGQREVADLLGRRQERLAVVYHNIAPAEPFERFDPRFARLLREGRDELASLAGRAFRALAPSQYNAAELEALGFRDVRVVPGLLDTSRLLGTGAGGRAGAEAAPDPAPPTYLFVGQLLPHKRVEVLLGAIHLLALRLDVAPRLVVVGAARLPSYAQAVREFAASLRLEAFVHFLGQVPDDELAAQYRSATAFVTASVHEGFCAPIVEAMGFGLPVVARRAAAIPETVGSAGLLLPEAAGPVLFSEAMEELHADAAARARLREAARDRAACFLRDTGGDGLAGAVAGLLS